MNSGSEIFNICGNNEYTIKELALKIKNLTKSKSNIISQDNPLNRSEFEVLRRTGSSQKIDELIGEHNYLDLNNGLKRIKKYLDKL